MTVPPEAAASPAGTWWFSREKRVFLCRARREGDSSSLGSQRRPYGERESAFGPVSSFAVYNEAGGTTVPTMPKAGYLSACNGAG